MSLSDEEQDYFSDADLASGGDDEGGYNNELQEGDNGLAMGDTKDSEALRSFKTMSSADLEEEIRGKVNDVMIVLELEYEVASVILRHFRWNKERLLEDYMDSPDKVLYESGGGKLSSPPVEPPVSDEPPTKKNRNSKLHSRLSRSLTAVRSSPRLSAKAKAQTMKVSTSTPERMAKNAAESNSSISTSEHVTSSTTCEICCDTPSDPSSTMYRPRCDHSFCKPCWSDYVRGKVEDDRVVNVVCMQESCKTVLLESELKELLDKHNFARYQQLVQDSYVLQDKSIKFCPFPACNHALRTKHKVDQASILTIVPIATCIASSPLHTFCFNCETRGDHRPLICTLAAKWVNHVCEDAGSVSWIISHTKVCPKCQKPVEKNGGCNHMTCSQCNASWCWGCGQLQTICKGQCYRFTADSAKEITDKVNQSRADLEKWLFYYDRFMNHEKSTQLEKDLVARLEEQITSIVSISEMSWVEARFLRNAVDVLMKCRETLKWSYGMAYYLETGNMKVLFEDLQGELEKRVEELSHLLEENVTADSIRDLRLEIVNKAAHVQKQHQLMLKDVEDGFNEGRWKWLVSMPLEIMLFYTQNELAKAPQEPQPENEPIDDDNHQAEQAQLSQPGSPVSVASYHSYETQTIHRKVPDFLVARVDE